MEATGFSVERRAVSSGEPSLDGSVDEERGALSDSDVAGVARIETLATQAKGPSSDELESQCRFEQSLSSAQEDESNKWIDILGSGQLFRKVLRPGDGPKARNGQKVTIRVKDIGLGIDSTSEKSFILGYSMVIDAWEIVLQLMHEGESNVVKADHRFAYGAFGDPTRKIKSFQTMIYEIELLNIGDGPIYALLDKDALIQHITDLKERGSYYFGRKEIDKALFVYKRSTEIVDVSKPENESLRDLLSVIYSNISVCYAKIGDWKSTLDASSEALNLNSHNTKALFRRANAFANLNFIEEAMDTLSIAHRIDPDDELILQGLHRLKLKMELCREQERTLCKRMISGARTENQKHNQRYANRFRYPLITFFVFAFALFIHYSRIAFGW